MKAAPVLAIVVPCYNEEAVIGLSAAALEGVLKGLIAKGKIQEKSFILFVDDGSEDSTWERITALNEAKSSVFKGLKFSRNFGHQSAILAGMLSARRKADCIITIDADLQHDTSVMETFVDRYHEGCEVVYGVKRSRAEDPFFKSFTAVAFYRIMKLMGAKIIHNHADYRLVGRRAMDAIARMREANLFLRGIFPLVGYRSATVEFDVKPRTAGKTKYTVSKMLGLAVDGITSFSVTPLRLITAVGFIVFLFSFAMSLYILGMTIGGFTVPGWASTVLPIYFLGGIQMISLGIIGEYVGKVYVEGKRRPRFIVETRLD